MPFTHNHLTIAGNLTRDPELNQAGEHVVARFTVAINRVSRDRSGERQEHATFIDCEAWDRTGELVAQYLSKGRPVFVEGRLQQDQWTNANGDRRSKLKVVATNVQFLNGRMDENGERNGATANQRQATPARQQAAQGGMPGRTMPTAPMPAHDDDDMPF